MHKNFDPGHTTSGFEHLPSGALNNYQLLQKEISIDKEGFLYVYLANESPYDQGVWFDDFKVEVTKSKVTEVSDYYPFGMLQAGNSTNSSDPTGNKYLFQGQELQEDLGLEWYHFKWRMHDPAVGRFFAVDPLAEKYVHNAPYAFSENKVTSHVELEGLEAVSIQAEGRGILPVVGNLAVTASGAYGIAIGTRRDHDGLHAVQYISGSLGPGSGVGVSLGIGTYVNSGDLEDLSGLGFGAGGFLSPMPGLTGGSFEINSTSDGTQFGGLVPFVSPSKAAGGGVWVEGSYTHFIGEPVNLTEMSDELMNSISESLGITVEQLGELVNQASEYINNQNSTNNLPSIEEIERELSQGYLVPNDATRVENNYR